MIRIRYHLSFLNSRNAVILGRGSAAFCRCGKNDFIVGGAGVLEI